MKVPTIIHTFGRIKVDWEKCRVSAWRYVAVTER